MLVISLVADQIEISSDVSRKVPGTSSILNTIEGFGNQVNHWISSWFSGGGGPRGADPTSRPGLRRLNLVDLEGQRIQTRVNQIPWWQKLFSNQPGTVAKARAWDEYVNYLNARHGPSGNPGNLDSGSTIVPSTPRPAINPTPPTDPVSPLTLVAPLPSGSDSIVAPEAGNLLAEGTDTAIVTTPWPHYPPHFNDHTPVLDPAIGTRVRCSGTAFDYVNSIAVNTVLPDSPILNNIPLPVEPVINSTTDMPVTSGDWL